MKVTFLGTSAMMPTKERATSCVFLKFQQYGILFDCGEGAQRQMKVAGIKPSEINIILLSHWHGDHVLGLTGLIQTIGSLETPQQIDIYGPDGTKEYFDHMMKSVVFDYRTPVKYHEVKEGKILEKEEFIIETLPLKHKTPCNAYAFVEKDRLRINVEYTKKKGIPEGPLLGQLQAGKSITFKGEKIEVEKATKTVHGKKIAYVTDTNLVENCIKIAKNADLLICESSYTSELKEKADEYFHLTARDAGLIATQAGAKKLALTHISARYKTNSEIEEDATTSFDDVVVAKDFTKIEV